MPKTPVFQDLEFSHILVCEDEEGRRSLLTQRGVQERAARATGLRVVREPHQGEEEGKRKTFYSGNP